MPPGCGLERPSAETEGRCSHACGGGRGTWVFTGNLGKKDFPWLNASGNPGQIALTGLPFSRAAQSFVGEDAGRLPTQALRAWPAESSPQRASSPALPPRARTGQKRRADPTLHPLQDPGKDRLPAGVGGGSQLPVPPTALGSAPTSGSSTQQSGNSRITMSTHCPSCEVQLRNQIHVFVAQRVQRPTSIREDAGSSPDSLSGVRIQCRS